MPDPDQYAAELAVALRDDWQFSRIFAKAKARPGFTALLALRVELQRVATTSEPGITAMKFEWWRNEIERGFAAEAQHPLVHALGKHLGKAGCAPEYCLELVDAAETESGFPAGFSEQDFQLYLYRSGGVLAELLAQLSGVTDRAALDAARRLGQTKRFSDLLLSTGVMLRAERWLFPARWLADAGLTLQELQAGEGSTAATRALLDGMLAALDQERIAARTTMEGVRLPPALILQWQLAQRDYVMLRKRPSRALAKQPAKDGMLSRLWTAWRGMRRSIKDQAKHVHA